MPYLEGFPPNNYHNPFNQMIVRLKSFLPASRFARYVYLLAGGGASGQFLVVIASPLLTRLYDPQDFGVLAVYAGILSVIGVIASLCYEQAIPLPENEKDAVNVTVLSAQVVIGVAFLCAFTVYLWGEQIATGLNVSAIGSYLWLLPVGVLLIGFYQVLNSWSVREERFSAIAKTKLMQSTVMIVIQLGGYALGPLALILGQIGGQAAGGGSLFFQSVRNKWKLFIKVQQKDVFKAANRWRRFPFYSSWSSLLNTTGMQLPLIAFGVLFSPAYAGIYMLANRVLNMPMQLLGQAVANVFYSRSSEAHREGRLAPMVGRIHDTLTHVAMPPVLVLIIAGPDIFSMVFGPEWRQAGEFAPWMAPWIYMVFITSPLSQLFFVLEKQALGLLFQIVLFLTRVFGLMVGAYLGDIMLAVALFSVSSAVCWIGLMMWIMHASGNKITNVFGSTMRAIFISVPITSPIIAHYTLLDGQGFWIIMMIATGLLIVSRYLYIIKKI